LEFDIRRGDDRDVAAIDLDLTTHTLRSTLKLDSDSGRDLKVTDYQNQHSFQWCDLENLQNQNQLGHFKDRFHKFTIF